MAVKQFIDIVLELLDEKKMRGIKKRINIAAPETLFPRFILGTKADKIISIGRLHR